MSILDKVSMESCDRMQGALSVRGLTISHYDAVLHDEIKYLRRLLAEEMARNRAAADEAMD